MPHARLLTAALILTATSACAQQPSASIEQQLPSLIDTYKTLHQHPELSHHEEWTAAYLATALRKLGFTVTEHIGKYPDGTSADGIIAVLTNGPGPRLLLRTELDALPVTEKTSLPYASQQAGVMHACGHDLHITTILGTAQQLVAQKSAWHGTLMIVGQPAEELGDGARAMLADHVYERFGRPDFVLAEHDVSDIAAGKVGVVSGPFKSGLASIDVLMRGIGGHGAKPEQTKDPVVMAGEFIMMLQTIVSRHNSPQQPAVITIGHIVGGTKRNIIPDEVLMELTMRSFDDAQRDAMIADVQRIAKGIAIAGNVPEDRMPIVTVSKSEYAPVTFNDPALADKFRAVAKATLGPQNLVETKASMASEDFGEWALPDHSVPIFCFWLGASDPAKVAESERTGIPLPATHSPNFAPIPEPSLRAGITAMTAMSMALLNK